MTRRTWLRLALGGARWLDRTGLRRLRPVDWLAGKVSRLVFERGDFPAPYIETVLDGFRLRLPKQLSASYVLRSFEPRSRRFMEQSLHPGGVVVDVGANVGFHSLFFARAVGPEGKVHAVEPAGDNLAFLRWNVQANRAQNIEIHPFAAGAVDRLRTFHLLPKGTHHGFYPREDVSGNVVEVRERPLSDLLPAPLDLVKIDTEGAEVEVLRGMERLLHDSPSVRLLVEWNLAVLHEQGLPLEELPELLAAWGFEVHVIDEEQRRERQVSEVLETVQAGRFGRLRALNLAARPTGSPAESTEAPR